MSKSNYSSLIINTNPPIPKDRATINALARNFYATNADVNRIINKHALYITGCFNLQKSKSSKLNKFCKEQLDAVELPFILENMIVEYFVVGEVFPYMNLDESKGIYDKILLQNPDYIVVNKNITDYSFGLRPDENLRRLVFSIKKEDIEQAKKISQNIIDNIREGKNIPLDDFYFSHIVRRLSPYEVRGTSLILPIFELLMSDDKSESNLENIKSSLFDPEIKGEISKGVILTRYASIAAKFSNWINHKILAPSCKINGFSCDEIPLVQFNFNKLRKSL